MLRDDVIRYGTIAQILHWLVAALIFVMFGLGWYMADLPLGPRKAELYQLHRSIGLTIFALAILRLAWRLGHPAPPLPAHMVPWERIAAHATHALFYAMLLIQPLIGILQSNAANAAVVVWGLIPLPALIAPDEQLAKALVDVHEWGARIILVLVLLHIAAALRHHWWLKDDVLRRMLPASLVGR